MPSRNTTSSEHLLELIRGKKATAAGGADAAPGPAEAPAGRKRAGRGLSFPDLGTRGKNFVVGADIHAGFLRLVKMRPSKGQHEIVDARQFPLPPDADQDGPAFAEFLRGRLKEFCGSSRQVELWSRVPTSAVEIFFFRVPKVSRAHIVQAAQWVLKKERQYDDKDYVLDVAILGEVREDKATKLDIVVCLAAKAAVAAVAGRFARAGFPLHGLTAAPFAVQALLKTGLVKPQSATAANIHIGPEWSRIDIYAKGSLKFNRSFMTGASSMIDALLDLYPSRAGGARAGHRPEGPDGLDVADEPPLHFGPAGRGPSGPSPLAGPVLDLSDDPEDPLPHKVRDVPEAGTAGRGVPDGEIEFELVLPDPAGGEDLEEAILLESEAVEALPLEPGAIELVDLGEDLDISFAPGAPFLADGDSGGVLLFEPLPQAAPAPEPLSGAAAPGDDGLDDLPGLDLDDAVGFGRAGPLSVPFPARRMGPAAADETISFVAPEDLEPPLEDLPDGAAARAGRGWTTFGSREEASSFLLDTGAAGLGEADRAGLLAPAADRLIRQVKRTFDYYTNTLSQGSVEEAYFSGEASANPAFVSCMVEQLGIPGQGLDPLAGGPSFGLTAAGRHQFAMAAALAACDNAAVPNLVFTFGDKEKLRRSLLLDKITYASFIAILLCLAGVYFWQQASISAEERRLAQLKAELAAYEPRATQPLLLQKATQINKLKQAMREASKHYESLALLNEIAGLASPSVKFQSIDLGFGRPEPTPDPKGPAGSAGAGAKGKPGADKNARTLLLEGYIVGDRRRHEGELARFLVRLQGSPLLAQPAVTLQEPRLLPQDGDVLYFVIQATAS